MMELAIHSSSSSSIFFPRITRTTPKPSSFLPPFSIPNNPTTIRTRITSAATAVRSEASSEKEEEAEEEEEKKVKESNKSSSISISPSPPKSSTEKSLGFGSSSGSTSSRKDKKKKNRQRATVIRRSPVEKPSLFSSQADSQPQQQTANENAFLLTWLGLGFLILVEGIALAASGLLPEQWDKFFVKYLYPSFTPTVFLFVGGTVAYGVLKYLQSEERKS
ncbi:protein LOW PSII ACCUMULATION 2, chloroplastic [Cinnamomum micranthum f. kanehirae]|uniref:Protein LOW PSII ACCUMULATION 2, chloroplastic n=1 Tax=Cinnamomum micranthum f. kanehirae TaxID=337451 RepID=A0A443P7A8_9MAGN|nr:protein LOW PSII ACCUMULATION 2, chloroplastic [Cinnamomum micranthum f. kanehirae]